MDEFELNRIFFFFHEPTIIGMVRIGADTTLRSSQPAPPLTVKATEVQCRRYREDGGKPQWKLRKTDAEHGGTQNSRARRAGIDRM